MERAKRPLSEIQADALALVADLARVRTALSAPELHRHHLPTIRGAEWEDMREGRRPPSLAWHLAAVLDSIEDDDLRPVEDKLRAAAAITAADLEREWTHDQAEDGGP